MPVIDEVNRKDTYAGFWKRLAAAVLDGMITVYFGSMFRYLFTEIINMQSGYNSYEEGQMLGLLIWNVYMLALQWAYFAGMQSSPLRATVGKYLVGIEVTDERGGRITFGQASGRYFGKIVSGAILFIGYLMAAFTERKQALHDIMSGTFVTERGE